MTSGESLAIIAAHPEPAYDPTHGLLSRRSTDRDDVSFRWVEYTKRISLAQYKMYTFLAQY